MKRTSRRRARPPQEPIPVETPTPLDIARCPKCEAPMAVRHGRHGPYYTCRCPINRNLAPPQNRNEKRVAE